MKLPPGVLTVLLIGSLAGAAPPGPAGEQEALEATRERKPPPFQEVPFATTPVAELARFRVVLTTDLGELEIAFFPEEAPRHVRQFLRFAKLGFYTGTQFHLVVPGFMIQGGALGSRQPRVPPELTLYVRPLKAEFNKRKHVRGTVSMARGSDADSAVGSFFILLASAPNLDGRYTVFGEVARGIDTVDGISQMPERGGKPIVPVFIEDVRLRERE